MDGRYTTEEEPKKRRASDQEPARLEAFINDVTIYFDMADGQRVAAKMTDAMAREVAVLLNNHFAQKHREHKKFMA